jgi:hypothetical protein
MTSQVGHTQSETKILLECVYTLLTPLDDVAAFFMSHRVCQEPQAIQEQPVKMESQACRVHQVYQGQLEEEVREGSQERGAQWDPLGGLDPVARSVLKDLTDCL